MSTKNPLATDLTYIFDHTATLWEELRGKRIFITGGTGFFGCWLLESFCFANDQLNLQSAAVVLTRNIEAFAKKAPHLTRHQALSFHLGDINTFVFPSGTFSHIIHAATAVSSSLNQDDHTILTTIIGGTKRVLDFATHCKATKLLFISSGATYGTQPPTLEYLAEDYDYNHVHHAQQQKWHPREMTSYGIGKRNAEKLCIDYAKSRHTDGLTATIARCFAFVGPYMPLDAQFAIGNFILDGLRGNAIRVQSDGTSYRSYLYAADLMIWLWHILILGEQCYAYNVGSDQAISIGDVARLVASSFQPPPKVIIEKIADPNKLAERYVPSVQLIKKAFNLQAEIPIIDAIAKTKQWYVGKI